ncbi:MAG: hypothetical protein L0I76_16370 [Pseudonocardia sp.]|nr:hypothetical protein [Pseudonocardia sp.]
MPATRTDPSLKDLDRGLLISAAALVAVGGTVTASGAALFTAALWRAWRHWLRRADLPPADLARLKLAQARAAAGAGAGAWRDKEPAGA